MELSNRTVDELGNVVFRVSDLFPLILKGYDVNKFLVEKGPEVEQLRETCKLLDNMELMPRVYEVPQVNPDQVFDDYRNKWLIPERYKVLDLRVWLTEKCKTQEERDRILREMQVFEKYALQDMLRSLVYIVDIFMKHKVVWGVGRGSSVASYVLFLIGIHRVNSLKYELDFSEFLD